MNNPLDRFTFWDEKPELTKVKQMPMNDKYLVKFKKALANQKYFRGKKFQGKIRRRYFKWKHAADKYFMMAVKTPGMIIP